MAGLQDLVGMAPAPELPPGVDPNSLMQLLQLGSVDQRHKLLQGQFDQAGQLAQGAPVDYAHGKGTPLLLASLANLISSGLGGYQQGKATQGLHSLLDEQTAGRTSAANTAMNAPTPDLRSLLTAPDADLPGKAQAAQDAIGRRGKLGMLLSMTGDPTLAPAAKTLTGTADEAQQTLLGAPQARVGLQEAIQKLRNEGPQEGLGGKTSKVFDLLTHREQVEQGKFTLVKDQFGNPIGVVDMKTATFKPLPAGAVKSGAGGGEGGGLTGPALDEAAKLFHMTGTLPPVGMGTAGAATRRQIMNRAAEMFPEGGIAGNKANYKADTGSLATAQKQADSIESFENTALKNLDAFLTTAKGISDSGIPIANKPIRAIADQLAGSPAQAQFNAARQVAIQEISKVLGGAVSGGAVTEGQRHEVEGLMRGDATVEQLQAVAQTLKQDMANRKASVNAQLATIRGRMSGKPAAAEAPAAEPKVRKFTRGQDGKLVEVGQ